ncbi:hypothetical protein FOL47_006493 [Perkinsus chesapeaki]|uniref:Uncharacterized protein n=1 Tax=Perkinsus chesapeaki TaxID=330153 RepID=A0A7J6LST4_PERCH|nr:hypothetical protein FOL47_006493 [Perkinsus chesapeaki]
MPEFIGNGDYAGDGGAVLQKLWESHKWKEIKNCPGRYVSPRDKKLCSATPTELLDTLISEVQWMAVTSCPLETIEGRTGDNVVFRGAHIAATTAKKDSSWFFTFPRGGGLITYEKADGVFVHTLNTESGLLRKMTAVDPNALPIALNLDREERFLVRTLQYLDDPSQNAGAYPLVLLMRMIV